MDRIKAFVVAAAAGAVGIVALATVLSSTGPAPGVAFVGLTVPDDARDGQSAAPLRLAALDGPAPTAVVGYATPELRVIVVKVPADALQEAAAATGQPTGLWAVDHPDEPQMRLLAYDARSTHLGCTVSLGPYGGWLDIARDDRRRTIALMDPCSQSAFDALAMGLQPVHAPAPRPLGVVPLRLGPGEDPQLLAGPSIEQQAPFDAAKGTEGLRRLSRW